MDREDDLEKGDRSSFGDQSDHIAERYNSDFNARTPVDISKMQSPMPFLTRNSDSPKDSGRSKFKKSEDSEAEEIRNKSGQIQSYDSGNSSDEEKKTKVNNYSRKTQRKISDKTFNTTGQLRKSNDAPTYTSETKKKLQYDRKANKEDSSFNESSAQASMDLDQFFDQTKQPAKFNQTTTTNIQDKRKPGQIQVQMTRINNPAENPEHANPEGSVSDGVVSREESKNEPAEEVENETSSEDEDKDPDDLIKLVNVHKTYLMGLEGVQALRGVNLTVKKGEFVIILGTSGGGKTTLLNIIGTIDKPTKGDLYLCGLRVKNNTNDKLLASIRLNKVAFVFQSFNLISSLTAIENVELPMQLKGNISRSKIYKRAKELLSKVGLEERIDHFPNQLSGGEQQRVTIARALSNRPTILLLDEPTGDLDTRSSDIVMKIIMDLNLHDKITMVMVTHDVALKNFASKIVRMSDGKVGSIEEISHDERMKHYNKLARRVEAIEKGLDKQKLNVRQGIEAYESGDEEEEGKEEEKQEDAPRRINDSRDEDDEKPEDPSEKRELPNRMKFIEHKRSQMTSVRVPSDYPYKKRVCYLD